MEKFYLQATELSPEILFSPAQGKFLIKGNSRPEDVRELYWPVIEWLNSYLDYLSEGSNNKYNDSNPLTFEFDLEYFNSSSAKFFYDIVMTIRKFPGANIPVRILWKYEEEDTDMKEAGEDLAILAEIEFEYIQKEDL